MKLKRLESKGLSHFSYLLEDGGEAVVIDPKRDIWDYICLLDEMGAGLSGIFETHRHEDFVSGGVELWERTGAPVYHGKRLDFGYGVPVADGDRFEIGGLELTVMETPGHTDESISIAVRKKGGIDDPLMVFTGDTLFYGDLGRIDLYGSDMSRTNAGKLYDSIHAKLIPLGDQTVVLPAHGSGSVCGGSIGNRDISTMGYERKESDLIGMDRELFITRKSAEELPVPPYFSKMEELNKIGPPVITVPERIHPTDLRRFLELKESGAQVIDVRDPLSYASGHIPGSTNIWLEGLSAFGGWFLNNEDPILVVDSDMSRMDEVWRSLVRLGFDNVKWGLSGGFKNYSMKGKKLRKVDMLDTEEMMKYIPGGENFLLDVRDKSSWDSDGHIPGATRIYVGNLKQRMKEVPIDRTILVYCDSGYKTGIAASLLLDEGFTEIKLLQGGMNAWRNADMMVEN